MKFFEFQIIKNFLNLYNKFDILAGKLKKMSKREGK
jgi:hypothetical protein